MATETLGQWLHQHVHHAHHRWGKQEAGVRRGDDPEAIHQMRVALRRLRAAMAGFPAVFNLPRVARKVGMISRVLGQARDGDVMLAALNDRYWPILPEPERGVLGRWMQDLAQQRQEMQRELVALLISATYRRVREAWAEWLAQPRYQPLGHWPVDAVLPHVLVMAWGELALHQGWRVGTAEADPELLHDLRKHIKRTRYLWEFAQEWLPPALVEPLGGLRQAQEVLGNLQDGFVLAARIGTGCPTLHHRLTQERAEHWQTWQTLREHLQNPVTHQRVYLSLGQPSFSPEALPPEHGTVHRSAVPLG